MVEDSQMNDLLRDEALIRNEDLLAEGKCQAALEQNTSRHRADTKKKKRRSRSTGSTPASPAAGLEGTAQPVEEKSGAGQRRTRRQPRRNYASINNG